jgi:hypothetical protein
MTGQNHCATILKMVIIYLLCVAPKYYFQDLKEYASKGILEIGGNISYQYNNYIVEGSDAYSENVFTFFPYVGYFITNNFELGVNPFGLRTSWNSADKTTSISIFLCPSYNFKATDAIFPFIEAQFGFTGQYTKYSFSELSTWKSGFSWGGRTGVKIILAEKCLLNAGWQYQQISMSPGSSPNRSGINSLMFFAGLTFWF